MIQFSTKVAVAIFAKRAFKDIVKMTANVPTAKSK